MSTSEQSDEPEGSSHGMNELVNSLTLQNPTWTFPPSSIPVPASPPVTENASSSSATPQPILFNTPARSIFSTGPPTSSLSANTAQASMSATLSSSSSRPLSALRTNSTGASRRAQPYQNGHSVSFATSRIPRAEKEVDDPSTPIERSSSAERRGHHTPTALTRLFAAPDTPSRQPSFHRTASGTPYIRASSESAPLPHHLYTRGLLNGRHSDITVHAFGTKYALHRLLLDRAPFFSSALSEPWFESTAKEITLHPEDIDPSITQAAFELALKRLYGCSISGEEDEEAIGLFATGCWLEMADLLDSSVESLLRQMSPVMLAEMIRLVTNNYYGKHGDRILASAKAMLCREGWEMPLKHWDGISGEVVREIIGGDGFFIPGEWERWVLAKRILDRRLRAKAIEYDLFEPSGKTKRKRRDTINFMAIRFDAVYRNSSTIGGPQNGNGDDPWLALYTHPDIAPILVLLDEGIHYIHLSFEQLQHIRSQRDFLGLPVMPEKVITNALWMAMELRQKVVNAEELDLELGLRHTAEEPTDESHVADDSAAIGMAKSPSVGSSESTNDKGKWVEIEVENVEEDEPESGSWDGNGMPRKFWIPNTDSTSVMGGNLEVATNAYNAASRAVGHVSRLSATIHPQDVQWASDFTASNADMPSTPSRSTTAAEAPPAISYSHFPPFRFSAEFPNPRLLKEKKRVYSRTVWYAGSMWNVYIQKVRSSKNVQLGVYLHRAKDDKNDEMVAGGVAQGSVHEAIGHLEREVLIRGSERRARRQEQGDVGLDVEGDASGSGGDLDAGIAPASSSSRPSPFSGLLRGDTVGKASQLPTLTLSSLPDRAYGTGPNADDEDDDLDYVGKMGSVSTMPPYVDGRPTIKTYFKIYSPSKGGRMLSVYESAPDQFNFSQSWGWKSSTMILDDSILGYEEGVRGKDGRLRFMVVIGNV
ncbi:MAG: hypothetical protein M1827_007748 [Pycnora praestabilis]|nr:MAG: hypothetical protein M1827_007748 [Pycnora praestabilis]